MAPTKKPPSSDRANIYPWPPIIYAVALSTAFALDRAAPLARLTFEGLLVQGFAVGAFGLGIAIAGVAYFKVVGTAVDPTGQASTLATGGIYQYTRNPMYLGTLILFTGIGLAMPSGWLLLAVPIIAILLRKLAIEPEEAYLARRFGDAYLAYCAKVRRWI